MKDSVMPVEADIVEHVTPADGNIFLDLGFEPEEAENLRVRSDLMIQIIRMIRDRGLKQKQAAALFGVSQPRISELKRGNIDEFSIDSLVNMLGHAGIRIDVSFRAVEEPAGEAAEPARAAAL
ncbi:MAG TPA: XRE family transcriptional regulator [Longimicrobium sp.]|jgi:predicted XRE-type DNA-binding protein|uniref:helix-turn-helix domain-containing protein n=1 Tax=Longimicrobium sp. TaxID=2029185 RepID=UPI002ED77123